MAKNFRHRTSQLHHTLIKEGEPLPGVYIIKTGAVEMTATLDPGLRHLAKNKSRLQLPIHMN